MNWEGQIEVTDFYRSQNPKTHEIYDRKTHLYKFEQFIVSVQTRVFVSLNS